jgi:hypothetical protein
MGMAYIRVSWKAMEKHGIFKEGLNTWLRMLEIADNENVVAIVDPHLDHTCLEWCILIQSRGMLDDFVEGSLVPNIGKCLYSDMDVKQWALDIRAEIMGIKVRHVPAD